METHQLLFKLSHSVRFEIIHTVDEKPERLTMIGEQADKNNPEVSRHLDRLKKSNLVDKDKDGYYLQMSRLMILSGQNTYMIP